MNKNLHMSYEHRNVQSIDEAIFFPLFIEPLNAGNEVRIDKMKEKKLRFR